MEADKVTNKAAKKERKEVNKINGVDMEIIVKVSYDGWTQCGKNNRECYRIQITPTTKYPVGTVLNLYSALKDGYTVTIKP